MISSRHILLVAFVACLPLTLSAQGRGGGMGRGRGGGGGRRGGGEGRRSSDEGRPAASINTVDLILLHKSDLALADSQVIKLDAIKATLDASVRPLKESLDSLTFLSASPDWKNMTDSARVAARERMVTRSRVLMEMQDVIVKSRDEALLQLTDGQKAKEAQLEEAQLKAERRE